MIPCELQLPIPLQNSH